MFRDRFLIFIQNSVIGRRGKTFVIKIGDKETNFSVDRLKPAYLIDGQSSLTDPNLYDKNELPSNDADISCKVSTSENVVKWPRYQASDTFCNVNIFAGGSGIRLLCVINICDKILLPF